MKKQASGIQYTIRGVSVEVDRGLRQKALNRGQSLNHVIVEELRTAVEGSRKIADFSDITGKWAADPAFDEIIASQRQVDFDKWK